MTTDPERRWLTLLDERATPTTARVYRARSAETPVPPTPPLLTDAARRTLRAVVDRLIPQSPDAFIDVAAALETERASGQGDGWRFEALPPDDVALTDGLARLDAAAVDRHGKPFTDLTAAEQDALLTAAQSGDLVWPGLPADLWFQDLLGQAVQIYAGHPRTLADMAFTGVMFARGWRGVGLNDVEAWEPETP